MGINKREKYLLGTTIASITLMTAALVLAVPFGTQTASVNEMTGLYGHVAILAIHPDGTANYIQGDNIIQNDGTDEAADRLWVDLPAAVKSGFNCIGLDESAAAGDDESNGPLTPAATATICADDSGVGGDGVIVTDSTGVGTSTSTEIISTFTIDAGDNGDSICAVFLDEGSGITISRFVLQPGCITVNTGTIFKVTYTMTI